MVLMVAADKTIYNNPGGGPSTSIFQGSGIRYAIAKWYSDRGWRVDNVYIPPDYGERYPWFALIGKYDADGRWMSHHVGMAPAASKLELEDKKRVAESKGTYSGGFLWVITLVSQSPLVYEADVQELTIRGSTVKWTSRRKETLKVE